MAIEEPSYVAAVRHLLQSTSQGSGTSQTNSTEGGTGSTAAGESSAGAYAICATELTCGIGLYRRTLISAHVAELVVPSLGWGPHVKSMSARECAARNRLLAWSIQCMAWMLRTRRCAQARNRRRRPSVSLPALRAPQRLRPAPVELWCQRLSVWYHLPWQPLRVLHSWRDL